MGDWELQVLQIFSAHFAPIIKLASDRQELAAILKGNVGFILLWNDDTQPDHKIDSSLGITLVVRGYLWFQMNKSVLLNARVLFGFSIGNMKRSPVSIDRYRVMTLPGVIGSRYL